MDTLTGYIAKNTMELKEANLCLSFISLIWRDQVVMLIFNNLNNTIIDSFPDISYQDSDLDKIRELIVNFLT